MFNLAGYDASFVGVALSDRTSRLRLDVLGPDRAKFLHNLTTNEVKRLPAGHGCEAFITSPQGKTIGFVTIHVCEESILIRTDPGGLALALPHLQKYGIFDDITLEDRSESTFEIHLAGPQASEAVRQAVGVSPPESDLAHGAVGGDDRRFWIVCESPTGRPGFTVIGPTGLKAGFLSTLRGLSPASGLEIADDAAFDAMRIEAGTPVFGRDLDETNLPQELSRDERAINFVKGCYLGQETVARIDAVGHVNRLLVGLKLDPTASPPAPGQALESDGKRVGILTSSAYSPGWSRPIALGLVRTTHAIPGARLSLSADGVGGPIDVEVCRLPMVPTP